MSAYREIKTVFKNLDSLKKALKDVGLDHFQLSSNPRLNTIQMQGYAGRQGESVALMLPKSHYGGYEDVGFAWDEQSKAYKALISTHDGGWGSHRDIGEATLQKVTQRYAYNEACRLAKMQGYTVREVKSTDGNIRLQLSKY